MDSRRYDPAERARQKQASRDEDERALAAGEKTMDDLRRENTIFAVPKAKLGVPVGER
jgi:hypothetical protein